MDDAPTYPRPCYLRPRTVEDLYVGPAPWDIGRPQPAMLALAEAGAVRGRVLDVGCGTGEHALMAAQLGLDATGVDQAARAVELARTKAHERGLAARFLLHDAKHVADLGETFDTVLESLVFHGFSGEDRTAYVAALHAATKPAGRYFMLCFRDEPPSRSERAHRVTPDEIRTALADGWRIDAIDAVTVVSALPTVPEGIRGWRTSATRI